MDASELRDKRSALERRIQLCEWVSIGAAVLVVLGVLGEIPKGGDRVFWSLLLTGVAVELVAVAANAAFTSRFNGLNRIREMELELELDRLRKPRNLSAEAWSKIGQVLFKFTPRQIDVLQTAPDHDSYWLATRIAEALGQHNDWPIGRFKHSVSTHMGVFVNSQSGAPREARALAQELLQIFLADGLLVAGVGSFSGMPEGEGEIINLTPMLAPGVTLEMQGEIRILVGSKM